MAARVQSGRLVPLQSSPPGPWTQAAMDVTAAIENAHTAEIENVHSSPPGEWTQTAMGVSTLIEASRNMSPATRAALRRFCPRDDSQ